MFDITVTWKEKTTTYHNVKLFYYFGVQPTIFVMKFEEESNLKKEIFVPITNDIIEIEIINKGASHDTF